ncbi:MAG: hypothetical protein M3Q69_13080 [Acidobacteriota bacterium]|nr:hypothetical protein [Acidobacteriota bacterium]
MNKWLIAIAFVLASSAEAMTVRVRAANVSATITGGAVDAVRAPNVRRVDAQTFELDATNGMQFVIPRDARVEWIGSGRAIGVIRDVAALRIDAAAGEVRAEQIRGNVEAKTANANVIARAIGGNVLVETGNGNVDVSGVDGLVDVTSQNGKTFIANVKSGVSVVSINGKTNISCVGGSVNVKDTSGQIEIANVSGDVDVFTALGAARYSGALAPARSYRMRTLDGRVTLAFAPDGSGYVAALASDAMHIEGDAVPQQRQKRMVVRTGNERARVMLDAVRGRVVLTRIASIDGCR